jgi:hypothetical protein
MAREYGSEHRLAGYIAYLERGCATHANYAQTVQEQVLELQAELDQAVELEAADFKIERIALRLHVLELQSSIHTSGLSTCIAGLAICAAIGADVPAPPPLPEEATSGDRTR